MKPELNLTNDEKMKIRAWKKSLEKGTRFVHVFIENGDKTETGYKLYDYSIETYDRYFNLIVSKNVELN